MKKLITILLFFVSINAVAQTEIFRIVGTDGSMFLWEYKDPDDGLWYTMTKYDDPDAGDVGLPLGVGDLETDNEVVEGKIFTNTNSGVQSGRSMIVTGDNVTIRNCIINTSHDMGIWAHDLIGFKVENSLFYDLAWGMLAEQITNNFKINTNQFLNMSWDRNDPSVGCCNGQSVFMNNVDGTGNEILGNHIENNIGESNNEDHINTYASDGTSGDHFDVNDNLIRGGGGGSLSSGGIIFGDNGSEYIDARRNKLVHPGWYGFQVFCGHNFIFEDNEVYSPITLPWNSVGFLVYKGQACTDQGGTCHTVTVGTSNKSYFRRATSYGGGIYDWETVDCGSPTAPASDNTITPATMGVPDHLINYLSIDDYWKLRDTRFREAIIVAAVEDFTPNANVRRPEADAGADQPSITTSSATLTSSSDIAVGGTGTFSLTGHSWTIVSGSGTITSPTSSTTTITGLTTGTTIVRYVVEQNNTQYSLKTYDPDWITLTVNIASPAQGIKMPVKIAALKNYINYKHNWYAKN